MVSGTIAGAYGGLDTGWSFSLWMVALLYVHELGHVVTARWRGLPVKRATFFLPGFGAFVMMQPDKASPWDKVLVFATGPVLGAGAAIARHMACILLFRPGLALAGRLALFVNLFVSSLW